MNHHWVLPMGQFLNQIEKCCNTNIGNQTTNKIDEKPTKIGKTTKTIGNGMKYIFVRYFEGLGGCTIQYFNDAIIGYGTLMLYININFIDS
jgi:hypothetical protein